MRRWGKLGAGALAVLVVAASVTFAVVQGSRLERSRAELAAAREAVAALREALAEAEADAAAAAEAAEAPQTEEPSSDTLEELFGDLGDLGDLGGSDELARLLEDLLGSLGDLGELEDLLGEGGAGGLSDVAACASVPPGEQVPDDDALAQIAFATERVQELRGLSFSGPVEPELVPPAEVSERLAELVEEEYSPEAADLDRRILSALRAVPADVDLLELQQELLGDQVAGYYDDETGDLVVRAPDPTQPLDVLVLTALAHELGHALVDDAIGLPELGEDPPDGDRDLAELAVVEGDAVILQSQFQTSALSPLDLLAAAGQAPDAGLLDAAPAYLRASLLFPYVEGAAFVCGHHRAGGWSAVDSLVAAPPATTAEILFPERYPAPAPRDLADPQALGGGWVEVAQRTFGAADLLWLLEAPGDDPAAAIADARERTRAWGAGDLVLATRGDDSALAVRVGEAAGEDGLCATFEELVAAAYDDLAPVGGGDAVLREGPDQAVALRCAGDEVRLAVAPDGTTAVRLLD